MLMPSKGWRDAVIPPGLKNRNRLKGRSLKTVFQEVLSCRVCTAEPECQLIRKRTI